MSAETQNWLDNYVLLSGTAWHRTNTDHINTFNGGIPLEAAKERLFGWEPVLAPLKVDVPMGEDTITITDNDRQVVARPAFGGLDPAVMGVFKSGYDHMGYEKSLLDPISNLLGDDILLSSAGLLRNGGQAWAQVALTQEHFVNDVEFRPFLTLSDSMNGTLANSAITGAIAVVCDNTLSMALAGKSSVYKIKHTKNSRFKIETAAEALGILHSVADDFTAGIEALTSFKVSDAEWEKFLDEYAPLNNEMTGRAQKFAETKRDELWVMYEKDARAAQWKGTAYGVLAAANTYQHHKSIVRGASREERAFASMVANEWESFDSDVIGSLSKVTGRDVLASI